MPIIMRRPKPRNGVYQAPKPIYEFATKVGKSALKRDQKDKLTVTVDSIKFEADNTAIIYMNTIITLANKEVLRLVAQEGMSFTDAYNTVFSGVIENWKTAMQDFTNVTVEQVAKALALAIENIGQIIQQYT